MVDFLENFNLSLSCAFEELGYIIALVFPFILFVIFCIMGLIVIYRDIKDMIDDYHYKKSYEQFYNDRLKQSGLDKENNVKSVRVVKVKNKKCKKRVVKKINNGVDKNDNWFIGLYF